MSFLDLSFWSIVPPLLTIILVIKTREVIVSMCIGIALGCMLLADLNPLHALETFVDTMIGVLNDDGTMIPGSITESENCMVILSMIMIGAMIGLLVKSGAPIALAEYLSTKINSKKRAGLMTCAIGTMLLIDDYFDSLTNGTIMRAISDKNKVSREKLSYYIDSTTYAICQISPVSSWVAFLASLMAMGLVTAGIEDNPYKILLESIPYNFFAIISLVMVYVVAALSINIGAMARAEKRVDETGKLAEHSFSGDEEDEYASVKIANGSARDMIIPIVVLIALVLAFMLYSGGFFTHHSISETVNNMDGILAMTCGFIIAIPFTIIYMWIRKVAIISELVSAAFVGVKSIIYAVFVLGFGWTLGNISKDLGITDFMISVFQGNIPPMVTPAILFIICAAMTFAIGGGWTTYAIMIPLVVPFAAATGSNMFLCLTAVIGGAGLGATCSPLADTSIVASSAGEIAILDHIKTQIPYALICGGIALVGYLVVGFLENLLIGYIVIAALFVVTVIFLKIKWGGGSGKIKTEVKNE